MAEHYYTQNPDAAHDEKTVIFESLGLQLRCVTDAGVFSRDGLDMGTRILLESLPEMHGEILDLGCGWGPVGVSIGKSWPGCAVVMSDVNERALALAGKNARDNGVTASTVLSSGLENVPGEFDYIITNPPIRAGKQVIYALFAQSARQLKPQGEMYLVIRRQQGAESAKRYLQTIFENVDTIEKSGGFWVIRCRGGKKE